MKTWISALILTGALTGTAWASEPGFVDRDGDLSASIVTEPRGSCAGAARGAVPENGAYIPGPHEVAPATGVWSAAAPAFVNGAAVPNGPGVADDAWCAGAYRPDAGTNFSGR